VVVLAVRRGDATRADPGEGHRVKKRAITVPAGSGSFSEADYSLSFPAFQGPERLDPEEPRTTGAWETSTALAPIANATLRWWSTPK
jgi:hypothetical protein